MGTENSVVQVELSFEQLAKAIRQLPPQEKMTIWRILDDEIDRPAIAARFADALQAIRSANPTASEEEVNAAIQQAIPLQF